MTSPPPPSPHSKQQFASILHSLERRSHSRAQSLSVLPNASPAAADPAWRRQKAHSLTDPELTVAFLHELENDLALAAEVGQALLKDKNELDRKVGGLEAANGGLLGRLTSAVKETSQLQRRLEEAVGNLEQAESNNRALLFSLEESRKTISRLTADQAKLVSTSSQLTQLTRTHSDLQQELSHEAKRAAAAEAKLRKQADRAKETEQRLAKAIEDLEEMRQDKVLRSRKSRDALTKVKAQLSAHSRDRLATKGMDPLATLAEENPEAAELLRIVEGLVNENDALRLESKELQDALELSREEQAALRTELAHKSAFPDIHEHDREDDDLADISAASSGNISKMSHSSRHMRLSHVSRRSVASIGANSLLAEVMASPSLDHDYDPLAHPRPFSSASASTASFGRHGSRTSISRPFGMAASTSTQSDELSRALSQASFASPNPGQAPRTSWDAEPDDVDGLRRPETTPRRGSGNIGALGLVTSGQKVPFGRGHVRRSMSVDVSALSNNPHIVARERSPSRAPSLFSVASDDQSTARTDKKHRPLSLSLGPSLFQRGSDERRVTSPTLGSAGQPLDRRPSYQSRRSSQMMPMSAPSDGPPVGWGSRPMRSRQSSVEPRPVVLVDSGTQTSPPPRSPAFSARAVSTPRQHANSTVRSLSPNRLFSKATLSTSATTTSELSADHSLGEHNLSEFSLETRTAALSALIDHTTKLLGRVQAADVATQERRLRKQNLPGDVRHVAQANLQAVVGDIENLRAHFRRVLELERANASALAGHAGDSLVLRKDFVGLVKLLRDVLYELSRLRSLVNRVELDPSAAANLRELDELNLDQLSAARADAHSPAAGLLAPFSRLWSSTTASPSLSPGHDIDPNHLSPHAPRPPAGPRAPLKREVSSAVSAATVNVEFGAGAARRAVATEGERAGAGSRSPSQGLSPSAAAGARPKTVSMVKRDLSSIFVGGALPSRPAAEPFVMVPGGSQVPQSHQSAQPPAPRRMPSANPFGRLLAGFPTSFTNSLATNAVTDSFQQTPARPAGDVETPPPTLLERQLRPRGLSDSSIRSTFTAHGGVGAVNPQHRILTKASLVLSAETSGAAAVARPVGIAGASGGGAGAGGGSEGLQARLAELSVSRKPSSGWLRPALGGGSSSRSASPAPPSPLSSGTPSAPAATSAAASPAPQPISISPPTISVAPSPAVSVKDADTANAPGGSLFTNLSQWAMGGKRGEGEVEALREGGEAAVAPSRVGVKAGSASVSSSLSSSMSGRAGRMA